jgi:uncharacterized coiled-coil protein SlyX
MAPEEAQQNAPRRRGRPPGSKNRRARRGRAGGGDLVGQLNSMVAELIKKNKQLQRQVAKLTEKAGANKAGKGVERGIRTLSRRVQKALGSKPTRRRRTASTNGRRKRTTTTRRRRASS